MLATLRVAEDRPPRQTQRRLFSRRRCMRAMARRLDHSVLAHRQPWVHLEIRDLTLDGMSALSDQPVAQGERLSVSFPPGHALCGWLALGRVVRCEPSTLGYRMAVAFDPLPAA